MRLALAGTAISAALYAYVSGMVLLDTRTFDRFRFWQVGTLAGHDLTVVTQLLPFFVVGTVLALSQARSLNALALGEDSGRALGAHVGRTRVLTAVAVTLLCGAATAAAGPIAFVGLAVPHLVRALTGPDQRWVLPLSCLVSPALLLFGDVLGRVVVRPGELEVSIVTASWGPRSSSPSSAVAGWPSCERRELRRGRPPPARGRRARAGRTVRAGRALSVRVEGRTLAVCVTLLVLLAAVVSVSLTTGDYPISVPDVLRTLVGRGERADEFIVLGLRLPRVVTGLLVGAALGVAGAVFQLVTRNPLGSPTSSASPPGPSPGPSWSCSSCSSAAGPCPSGRWSAAGSPRPSSTCCPVAAACRGTG